MTFKAKTNTFNLTMTKMSHWHRHALHKLADPEVQEKCAFCNGDFKAIKTLLQKKGIKVVKQGSNWLEIKATTNVRVERFGTTSDEVDLLFRIVTGADNSARMEEIRKHNAIVLARIKERRKIY